MQILGVFKPGLTELMANALDKLGSDKALVVHGMEGLDEISIKGESKISELADGRIMTYIVKPSDFGLKEGKIDEIRGKDVEYNKRVVLEILEGKDKTSRRDMVLMNAAACLKMVGLADEFKDGVGIAADCVDSGKALDKLNRMREESNR